MLYSDFYHIFTYKYNYMLIKKKSGRPKTSTEPNVTWPILMKKSLKEKYKAFCDRQGISMNRRVKLLMEKDMNGEVKMI